MEITLDVSAETARRFQEKAERDGTTAAQVLAGFVNDLMYTDASNGSDERMLANDYYKRTWYGRGAGEWL